MFHERQQFIFINLFLPCIFGLSCVEVLELPEKTKLQLYHLQSMEPNETVKCLTHLARQKLTLAEARLIWNNIIEFHNGPQNIPDEILKELQWVSSAVTPEEFSNLTLSDIDVISNLGIDHGLTQAQLEAVAERIREDFGEKQPEDYTGYDLIGLRQILCAFNVSEIDRIHPKAYKEAAHVIGNLTNCKYEVMEAFARLAVKKTAFGPPKLWTSSILQILGSVADFFPKDLINTIKSRKEAIH